MLQPVILAGGSGERLWPLSRKAIPKPFLALSKQTDKTLYQLTLGRIASFKDTLAPIVICQEEHRFLAGEQARNANVEIEKIILEPSQKNTAPATVLACLYTKKHVSRANSIIILPADHIFSSTNSFHDALEQALITTNNFDKIVTIGIKPSHPETGYGYICCGDKIANTNANDIASFIEKPKLSIAEKIYSDSKYLWNAGVFVSSIDSLLNEFDKFDHENIENCKLALKNATNDRDFVRPDSSHFNSCNSISIDYSIMEKTSKGAVVALQSHWEDLGNWQAMWQHHEKDESSNVTVGKVVNYDSKNSYIHSESKLIATQGIDSLVVVDSEDAILVTTKEHASNLSTLIKEIKSQYPDKILNHKRVPRPWGFFDSIMLTDNFQVKLLSIMPGCSISLQLHNHREEHWVVVSGKAKVIRGDETLHLICGESIHIPIKTKHQLINIGDDNLQIVEVQTGTYFGEDDIIRFADAYGRANTEKIET